MAERGLVGVVKRGEESPRAFSKRVWHDLGDNNNILVINDEAHHDYRPAPRELGVKQEMLEVENEKEEELSAAERKEREEAAEEANGLGGGPR